MPPSKQHLRAHKDSAESIQSGNQLFSPTSLHTATVTPLNLIPEKALFSHQLRSTVPAQYWSAPIASPSTPDGAQPASLSEPLPLPLLSGSGVSRPHLILATQALKLPGRPSLVGLPSFCHSQGGVVLDRVLAHRSGDAWWAVLTGRARVGRMWARQGQPLSAVTDPANYALCASSRLQLNETTVLRSRLDLSGPHSPGGLPFHTARSTPTSTSTPSPSSPGWPTTPPMSLTCQLRSRLGPRTETRADLAVGQGYTVPPSGLTPSSVSSSSPVVALQMDGGGGSGAKSGVVTPLLVGLQAGSMAGSAAPLVWRCGMLQVTAPPTVPLAGSHADAEVPGTPTDGGSSGGGGGRGGGPALKSAVYVQGSVALQGERYLWRALKKPLPRQPRNRQEATSATSAPQKTSSSDGPTPTTTTITNLASVAPYNPTARQGLATGARQPPQRLPTTTSTTTTSPAAQGDDDDGDVITSNDRTEGQQTTALRRLAPTVTVRSLCNVTSGSAAGAAQPFDVIELPSAGSVQDALADAHETLGRLRDDVAQATEWLTSGGLMNQLTGVEEAGRCAGRNSAGGEAGGAGPVQPQPALPWSAFVGEPHIRVAGTVGVTARTPVILVSHGASGPALSPGKTASAAAAGDGPIRVGSSLALWPLHDVWVQDFGVRRLVQALLGREAFGAERGGAAEPTLGLPNGINDTASRGGGGVGGGGAEPHGRTAAVRPFASAAVSVQAGRFTGWVLDFTRLTCRVDGGLWGPTGRAVTPGPVPSTQPTLSPARACRHPAFALGDTGAWHCLSLSLCQQLLGPLRLAADWRFLLASNKPLALPPPPSPYTGGGGAVSRLAAAAAATGAWLPSAAGHVSGMRPQLMEAVYALDLAVPGSRGAARLVAWYAPQRREGMVEMRLF